MWSATGEFWLSPRSAFDWRDLRFLCVSSARLMLEQCDAAADEYGRQPAAAINVFVQQPSCRYGVADKRKRTCCRSNEAHVRMAQREEQREETQGHEGAAG